jgi:hypothetical protein
MVKGDYMRMGGKKDHVRMRKLERERGNEERANSDILMHIQRYNSITRESMRERK